MRALNAILGAGVIAWGALAAPAIAQTRHYVIADGSTVSYHVHVTTVGVLHEVIDGRNDDVHGQIALPDAGQPTGTISAAIAGFRSGIKGRDRHVGHMLGAPDLATIDYRLVALDGFDRTRSQGEAVARGVLTVNHHAQTVQVPIHYHVDAQRLTVDGEAPLHFTDFGIDPPVLGLVLKRAPNLFTIGVHLVATAASR